MSLNHPSTSQSVSLQSEQFVDWTTWRLFSFHI